MPLADAHDAAVKIAAFAREAADRGVPVSSFHFGSGCAEPSYSIARDWVICFTLRFCRYCMSPQGLRLTFEWNRSKFPEPEALIKDGLKAGCGLRVVANVKARHSPPAPFPSSFQTLLLTLSLDVRARPLQPCLLLAHPRYAAAAAEGLLVKASAGGGGAPPRVSLFWDAEGGHIDFANARAVQWWTEGVTASLLRLGVDAVWARRRSRAARRVVMILAQHTPHAPAPDARPRRASARRTTTTSTKSRRRRGRLTARRRTAALMRQTPRPPRPCRCCARCSRCSWRARRSPPRPPSRRTSGRSGAIAEATLLIIKIFYIFC